jgi:translocation and assembly module TamA
MPNPFRSLFLAVSLASLPVMGSALEVSVTGGVNEDQTAALRVASLSATLDETATPADILAAAQADYGRLVSALYAQGYYGPTVRIKVDGREAGSIDPVSPPASVRTVGITVTTGPQFRFGQTRIGPLAEGTELPPAFASGEVAAVTLLRAATSAGVDGWRALGHAKAAVADQQIRANHAAQRLDATITLAPGPRLRFGALEMEGTSAVRAERIRAIAGLPTGTVYSPDEVRRATTRLRRSGAFTSVVLQEADVPNSDGSLDLTAQVVDQRPRRFGVGGEISSLDGVALSGFWMHRNLTGAADRLRFDAAIAGIGGTQGGTDYSVSTRYTRPASFNADTDLFVAGEIARENEEAFTQDFINAAIGYTRYVNDEVEISVALEFETAKTTDAFGTRSYTTIGLPLKGTADYRDDARDATSGFFAEATVMPYVGVGTVDGGLYLTADLRGYYTLGTTRPVTLAARAQFGGLTGPSLSRAPSGLLFFSGGGGTVRGHSYQSLAVDLGGGLEVGGRSFLGLSTEARVGVTETISVVGFVDAGYIGSESFPDGSNGEWHSGAGLGLRYATGIGPIRVDLALPVSGPGDASGLQFYVGIGQAF